MTWFTLSVVYTDVYGRNWVSDATVVIGLHLFQLSKWRCRMSIVAKATLIVTFIYHYDIAIYSANIIPEMRRKLSYTICFSCKKTS